ncbi:hypothetical protein H1C71_006208 [Ictidomys tridecemlineatus]|nr:hypothetical protein H1C71_006208 [Ictidomys tridecemlineatus]
MGLFVGSSVLLSHGPLSHSPASALAHHSAGIRAACVGISPCGAFHEEGTEVGLLRDAWCDPGTLSTGPSAPSAFQAQPTGLLAWPFCWILFFPFLAKPDARCGAALPWSFDCKLKPGAPSVPIMNPSNWAALAPGQVLSPTLDLHHLRNLLSIPGSGLTPFVPVFPEGILRHRKSEKLAELHRRLCWAGATREPDFRVHPCAPRSPCLFMV